MEIQLFFFPGKYANALTVITILPWIAIMGVIGVRLAEQWKRSTRQDRWQRGRCGSCNYDLRGIGEERCPECGTRIPAFGQDDFTLGLFGVLIRSKTVVIGMIGAWAAASTSLLIPVWFGPSDRALAIGSGALAAVGVCVATFRVYCLWQVVGNGLQVEAAIVRIGKMHFRWFDDRLPTFLETMERPTHRVDFRYLVGDREYLGWDDVRVELAAGCADPLLFVFVNRHRPSRYLLANRVLHVPAIMYSEGGTERESSWARSPVKAGPAFVVATIMTWLLAFLMYELREPGRALILLTYAMAGTILVVVRWSRRRPGTLPRGERDNRTSTPFALREAQRETPDKTKTLDPPIRMMLERAYGAQSTELTLFDSWTRRVEETPEGIPPPPMPPEIRDAIKILRARREPE